MKIFMRRRRTCLPRAKQPLRAVINRITVIFLSAGVLAGSAAANPYLARPGERPIHIRIATCAVSGGFAHLYTALENNLFDKYGFKTEHVFIRGSASSLAALMADEIRFLYCAADETIPSLATGVDVKLVAAPLLKLPYALVTRKEIRRLQDLKGKSLGVARAGDLSDRLSRLLVKKFNIADVVMRPIGGARRSATRRWWRGSCTELSLHRRSTSAPRTMVTTLPTD